MLETVAFAFSPSAAQASLQTSTIQVRNRTTGTVMSVTEQSEVKNHLSSRHRRGIHLAVPASQPDATGFSGEESGRPDSELVHLPNRSLSEPGLAVPEAHVLESEPDLRPFAVPAVSKIEHA